MTIPILQGIFIPFGGTVLGAALVFLLKGELSRGLQRALSGFAAGVMVAASVWSLLIPAMEQAAGLGSLSFLPAAVGLWLGFVFLMLLDKLVPHQHPGSEECEGPDCALPKSGKLFLAVALHNLPEGMAVGVVLAGWLAGGDTVSYATALALALGIALQNLPEGAIISLPLRGAGMSRRRAFAYGVASGVVEPLGAVLTLLLAQWLLPALPYALSFSAGAMLYVVVEELVPEMSEGEHGHIGTVFFALGFSMMMILDTALG